ncbi:TPR repeat-containing protein YfgC precursor [Planctopirus ephydatiae]|uniref:TPR repeat-containing protein YfgC n=1 Tax=Planctopirus ephydatiae TaxID=2528019 RepID=A0A518GST7_9PLAN|nr:M48 family metallopeptidase [Planctopirus ephydatiae]QDV31643.1 TPR repeat-containing protein YfgC precursor [Planctopirus ephydatiae]
MSYGNQPRRRGFRVQILIGLAIAGFALVRYFASLDVNPVTGERQFVAMSPQQELALGQQSAPEMAREMGGVVPPNDPRAAMVRQVGRKLVESSKAKDSPWQFQFHLLADPKTINAFALPGGQIFITMGLYSRLENEAQLAGVLGHEIGHVINRHSAEHMAKGQLGQMLGTAAGVAASDENSSGRNAQMAAMVVNQMLQMKYSRGDESESDAYGLVAMAEAGYDPSQMLGVMRILAEASQGNRQPEFLASHPHPESRIQQIEAWLKKNYPKGVPSNLTDGGSLNS